MKSSKQTLTESSFILIFSTALVKIISAFFKIPLASDSFLGEVGFGYFSVAHDLYMPFYTLAISGLPVAVSHLIAEKISINKKSEAASCFLSCHRLFLMCGTVFSVILSVVALLLITLNNGSQAAYSIFAVVPSVFLCFIISVYRGYFEGFSNMVPTAISKVIEALCKLVLGLFFSYTVLKFTGNIALSAAAAMSAVTVGTALSWLFLYLYHKKNQEFHFFNINNEQEKINLLDLFKISIPFVLASIAASLVSVIDIFAVKMPIDNANADYLNLIFSQNPEITGDISAYLYGVRSKAFTIYYLIPTFTATLGVGAVPIITSFCAKGDCKALAQNVSYTIKLVCVVTFPAALGMFALSGRIMELLYSSSGLLDENMMSIYSIAGFFAGVAIPITTVLQAIGKHKLSMINVIIGLTLKVISSILLVLIPSINIYAAPISTLLCYIYILVSVMWGIGKYVKNIDYISSVIKPLISAVLCGFAAYYISHISDKSAVTVIAILVAVLVYFGLILMTKTFTKTEIKSIPFVNRLFKSK